MRMRRVVVWGTGNMGSTAIRSTVAFPGLQLVGVITSSAEKAGRDAVDFAGLPEPTGARANTDVDEPGFRVDRSETIRLLHGRIGAEWDISSRIAIRTEGLMWFGAGLDWIMGVRAGVGYRF